jgi:hypothetical protein
MSKLPVPAIIALLICSFTACEDDPSGPGPIDSLYFECTDSAWKVVQNLEYAYNHRDLALYMNCFEDDFQFIFDADPTTPEPELESWGLEFEELCHESLFTSSSINSIQLMFTGYSDGPWSGSPDSTVIAAPRDFVLLVHLSNGGGFIATGAAEFVCSPDSSGEYLIALWNDQSEFKYSREGMTWPDIKRVLL